MSKVHQKYYLLEVGPYQYVVIKYGYYGHYTQSFLLNSVIYDNLSPTSDTLRRFGTM